MGKHNIWLRRISQALFLGLWGYLFWRTAAETEGLIPPDLFVSTDPLASILSMAAANVWIPGVAGGAVLLAATLLLGRFFCGWICPLGTLFDVVGRLFVGRRELSLPHDDAWRRIKYYLLVALVITALIGGPLLYWFDPLILLFRGVALGFVPSASAAGAFLPALLLVVTLGLCFVTHRFWCRYLCPLGALYGVFARFSIFRRHLEGCDRCKGSEVRECQHHCPVHGSVNRQGRPEECIRCMSCQAVCHTSGITFTPSWPIPTHREVLVDLDRRAFVASLGAGAVGGIAAANAGLGNGDDWRIVRPPMVTDPDTFNALCVRCGQCIRSCPTGTLQPLLLEAGFTGLWTPAVTPSIGGCQDNCNRCAVACPTNAIPSFGPTRKEKWALKMGSVAFEPDRCISYAPDAVKPCLKCVEVCPNRAIVIDEELTPTRPKLIAYDRCVGCGSCETACLDMVTGRPALTLNNHGMGTPAALVVDPAPAVPKK